MKKFAFTLVAGFGLFAGTSVAFADEQTHVVEPGDTLSSLAATYQTTIDDILSLNDSIEDPNLIFDGETLLIFSDGQPVGRKTTSSSTTEPTETQSQTAEENAAAATSSQTQSSTPGAGSGVLNPVDGINYYNGVRESYYSQKVLPGGGLSIPGRHVASDGTIRDADGYIVVASDNQAKGSTGQSSLGAYKVYDTGVGHSGIDVYTNW
ncbi:LysM domain-containing protein [Enterococcus sp.]|uniref:LysM peptidoglycan-binding domain-containing protein n=1 Tax=Enterococcus sp. TaxID=35783 RepID=UPI0028A08C0A|nr:LysM domain-containing protein [Enterococcus sp.]